MRNLRPNSKTRQNVFVHASLLQDNFVFALQTKVLPFFKNNCAVTHPLPFSKSKFSLKSDRDLEKKKIYSDSQQYPSKLCLIKHCIKYVCFHWTEFSCGHSWVAGGCYRLTLFFLQNFLKILFSMGNAGALTLSLLGYLKTRICWGGVNLTPLLIP